MPRRVALAGLVALACGALLLLGAQPGGSGARALVGPAERGPALLPRASPAPLPAAGGETALASSTASSTAATASARVWTGRVVDPEQRPLAGAVLTLLACARSETSEEEAARASPNPLSERSEAKA